MAGNDDIEMMLEGLFAVFFLHMHTHNGADAGARKFRINFSRSLGPAGNIEGNDSDRKSVV